MTIGALQAAEVAALARPGGGDEELQTRIKTRGAEPDTTIGQGAERLPYPIDTRDRSPRVNPLTSSPSAPTLSAVVIDAGMLVLPSRPHAFLAA